MLDRPDLDLMEIDPLSDVLALLRPRTTLSARLEAGGDWALRFPESAGTIKFLAVLSGHCWMQRDGDAAVALTPGDCFLMTRGRPYRLASDLALPDLDARDVYARASDGAARIGDGVDVRILGGRFDFGVSQADLLLDALPPVVHVPATSAAAPVVRWALEQLASESKRPHPGTRLMRGYLAHMLLLQILRTRLQTLDGPATGWLAALADPRIGSAIARLHAAPTARWTLAELAAQSAMSRSTFAARFRSLVGVAPLDYLQRLRMLQAAKALRESSDAVSVIGAMIGYDSDSAFSHAFKRFMGVSPVTYRSAEQARK